jgi:hypothetical protein
MSSILTEIVRSKIIQCFSLLEKFLTSFFRPILAVFSDFKNKIVDEKAYFRYDVYMYSKYEIGIEPSSVDGTGSYNKGNSIKTWINFDLRYKV